MLFAQIKLKTFNLEKSKTISLTLQGQGFKKKLNNHKQIYMYKNAYFNSFLITGHFFKVNQIYFDFLKKYSGIYLYKLECHFL